MPDVFVSYKREDLQRARDVVEMLSSHGLDVWWDQFIKPSDPWEATIEAALNGAKAVIVLWSENSVVSENVKAEARHARNTGRLIQVYIDDCAPPLFFGERQGIMLRKTLTGFESDGEARLVEAIRAQLSGQPFEAAALGKPKRKFPLLAAVVAGLVVTAAAASGFWFMQKGPNGSAVIGDGAERAVFLGLVRAETIGMNADFFESQVGAPPVTDFDSFKTYRIDGCDVSIQIDKNMIEAVSLDVSGSCSFEWRSILPNLGGLPSPEKTHFSDIMDSGSWWRVVGGCLEMCGNAAAPDIVIYREGSGADGLIDITVTSIQDTTAKIDAAFALRDKIKAEYPDEALYDLGEFCDRRMINWAKETIADMPVEHVSFGYRLAPPEPLNCGG